jgi:hypothetical protein
MANIYPQIGDVNPLYVVPEVKGRGQLGGALPRV